MGDYDNVDKNVDRRQTEGRGLQDIWETVMANHRGQGRCKQEACSWAPGMTAEQEDTREDPWEILNLNAA